MLLSESENDELGTKSDNEGGRRKWEKDTTKPWSNPYSAIRVLPPLSIEVTREAWPWQTQYIFSPAHKKEHILVPAHLSVFNHELSTPNLSNLHILKDYQILSQLQEFSLATTTARKTGHEKTRFDGALKKHDY